MLKTSKPDGVEYAFHEIRKAWWWFPANVAEMDKAALTWETVRRTESYKALSCKWYKVALPTLTNPGNRSLGDVFRNGDLIQRVGREIPKPYIDFLRMNFDPKLNWLEHSPQQRLEARGYLLGGSETVKANNELELPRQNSTHADAVSVVSRNYTHIDTETKRAALARLPDVTSLGAK